MLINLRNALMAGRRLPYDAEVEYLESTGTEYIDTLVNADSNLSVEITMANAGTPWTNVNPMGAILATPRCRHHLNFDSTVFGTCVIYYFGNGDSCKAISRYKPSDGEIFTFKVDAISKTFTLGSFLGTFPNDTFDIGLSYGLFGRIGTTPPQLGSLRIYSAKLWNGSTLVRDFIPVRVGTVGYMYDRVSGKLFGNAGTGDFVLGPDVVPVEWLSSDGGQYIDTGVVPTTTTEVSLDFDIVNQPSGLAIFGGTDIPGNKYATYAILRHNASGGSMYYFMIHYDDGLGVSLSAGRHSVIMNEYGTRRLVVDGVVAGTFTMSLSVNIPIFLFSRNSNGTASTQYAFPLNLYGTKIKDSNGDLVRKMLPVRVGTDATSWEGAMMDVLTRRIYRNAGTGAFTYGNDLKYPIPAE